MRQALLALLLLTTTAATSHAQERPPLPEADEVGDAAFTHIRILAGDIGPRPEGSEAEARGMAYAARIFSALGYEVHRRSVDSLEPGVADRPSWYPDRMILESANLVAVKPGRAPAIVLSAHMDSVDRLAPGANDDASAVAAVLEAARLLRTQPTQHEIRFIIFTGEEQGLIGSTSYVEGLKPGEVGAVVNADPLGYGTITASPMPWSAPLWFQGAALAESRDLGLSRFRIPAAWVLLPRLIPLPYGADHQPFLMADIPAWSLSNRMERWSYHTAADAPDIIEPRTVGEGTLLMTALALRFDTGLPEGVSGPGPRYGVLPLPWGTALPHGFLQVGMLLIALALVVLTILIGRRAVLPRLGSLLRTALLGLVFGAASGIPTFVDRLLSGFAHPWVGYPGVFLFAGLFCGLAVTWSAARITARSQPRSGDGSWTGAALIWMVHALLAWLLAGPDLALPFAWAAGGAVIALFASRALPGAAGGVLGALVAVLGIWPLASLMSPWTVREAVTLVGLAPSPLIMALLRGWLIWPVLLCAQAAWSALAGLRDPDGAPASGRIVLLRRPAAGGVLGILGLAGLAAGVVLPAYHGSFRQLVEERVEVDAAGIPVSATVSSWDRLKGLESDWPLLGDAADLTTALRIPSAPGPSGFRIQAVLDTTGSAGGWTTGTLRISAVAPVLASYMVLRFGSPDSARVEGMWFRRQDAAFTLRIQDAGARFEYTREIPVSIRTGSPLSLRVSLSAAGDVAGSLLGPSAERRQDVIVDAETRAEASFRFGADPPQGGSGGD